MSDAVERPATVANVSKLSNAIRDVKNAAADREDVVVELREAQHIRLELLAAELGPVFADVPAEVENFDFALSAGLQPRLWIDAVSHVAMGRDRRTYRFVKDTRLGRVVLAESVDMKPVADQVTRYIAERLVERQRMMEGGVEPVLENAGRAVQVEHRLAAIAKSDERLRDILTGLGLVIAGAIVGLLFTAVVLWDRVSALWSGS